jgi:predicted MFS family arabinose efflux permease
MERASGIRGSVQKGSQLIGGPLGGLLVASLGAPTALWANAASFLFSAALVAWIVPPTPHRRQEAPSFRTDLVEGWRFVRHHRLILAIVVTVLITNFLDAPFSVAMPVLANEAYGGAAELGLMYGAYGGMALLGSVLFSAFGHRLRRRPVLLGGYLAVPALYLVLASLPPLPAALITLALVGLATGGLNPVIYTVAYEKVPSELRGRVFGTMRAGAWAAIPAGVLLGGVVVQALGVVTTFLIIGLCYLAVVLYGFFNPAFRQLEKPSEPLEQPGIPDRF